MAESTSETQVIDLLTSMTGESVLASSLDERTLMMVRIAALVAVDAPSFSYRMNLEAGAETGLDAADLRGVLTAVAPIVGTARIMSATGKIAEVLEVEIDRQLRG